MPSLKKLQVSEVRKAGGNYIAIPDLVKRGHLMVPRVWALPFILLRFLLGTSASKRASNHLRVCGKLKNGDVFFVTLVDNQNQAIGEFFLSSPKAMLSRT
jgi:hypothetical protein